MTSAKTGGTALYRYEPDYAIPPGTSSRSSSRNRA
jgi:hypothetical protein